MKEFIVGMTITISGRDVVSDTISDAIAGLQQRERELELEACTIRARIEEVRDMLARLQHPGRRRGRPAGRVVPPLEVINTDTDDGDAA